MIFDDLIKLIFKDSYYVVTSEFGPRTLKGVQGFHRGMDFGTKLKKIPIYSPCDGIIKLTGLASSGSELGNVVYIDDKQKYIYQFAHLDSYVVKTGQVVKKGDLLGYVGTTGKSTAVHLHLGVCLRSLWSKPYNDRGWLNPRLLGKLTHTVSKGETLSKIATMYGTTWQELYNNNKDVIDNPDKIDIGDTIRIEILKKEPVNIVEKPNPQPVVEDTTKFELEKIQREKQELERLLSDYTYALTEREKLVIEYENYIKQINNAFPKQIYTAKRNGVFKIKLEEGMKLYITK